MNQRPYKTPALSFTDLDLTTLEGQLAWSERLQAFARQNVARHQERMKRLGVIDSQGKPCASELPADMEPHSKTSTE